MAKILCSRDYVVTISGSEVRVSALRDPATVHKFELRASTVEPEGQNAKKKSKNASKQEQQRRSEDTTLVEMDPHVSTGRVLTAAFSKSGCHFAACTDQKELSLWDVENSWTKMWTKVVAKRCMALTFDMHEAALFVADKAGDVYRFDIRDKAGDGVLILGHVSMLLDVVVSPDNQFIITAERDEKIRVSCLPNAYSIHTFCLGHTEFVNRLVILPSFDLLVSAAGDSSLRLWDYRAATELCRTSFNWAKAGDSDAGEKTDATVACLSCCCRHSLVAMAILQQPFVPVYRVGQQDGIWTMEEIVRLECTHPPWSLTFDPDGRLWILLPDPAKPIVVYRVETCEDGKLKFLEASSEDKLAFSGDWDFLKCSCNVPSEFAGLHKVPFDNMPDYLRRKQQRIQDFAAKKGHKRHRLQKKRAQKGGQDTGSPIEGASDGQEERSVVIGDGDDSEDGEEDDEDVEGESVAVGDGEANDGEVEEERNDAKKSKLDL
ncbi:tRNA (guanine-N(7)-)-methyltransferase non-catalytic subunit WDR4-like [Diadema antillarum]|uniref:tRNA (guanine-N(7)-)-methyltransferase non-catalytic subunit WDR4-like n=1 Tax=Diadema antillarum TaxID=105358 RepID=UPI003A87EEAF